MISSIFPTPIFHYKVSIPEDLIERIHKLMEFDPKGRTYTNVGGWQSKDIEHDPNFQDVIKVICECAKDAYPKFTPSNNRKVEVLSTWINVNKGEDFNTPHIHPFTHLAGCLYVKKNENSGSIVFENPLREIMYHYDMQITPENETETMKMFQAYNPSVGELILFPAWMFHHVEKSTDMEERITIAFNTVMR
jgi:uncharacterized protein (TIGR02466 family)